jgi:hypothetical protein
MGYQKYNKLMGELNRAIKAFEKKEQKAKEVK